MKLLDEEQQRWYCYKDDQPYLAKEDRWGPTPSTDRELPLCTRCRKGVLTPAQELGLTPLPQNAKWACKICKTILDSDLAPIVAYKVVAKTNWNAMASGLFTSVGLVILVWTWFGPPSFWVNILCALPWLIALQAKNRHLETTPIENAPEQAAGKLESGAPTTKEPALSDRETKFCRKCGAKMPRDSMFCEECGKKLA